MWLNQTNSPRLWLLFQLLIGGTKDKRALALSSWSGRRNVLEIGCSIGNIADAFRNLPDIVYTGIDIDGQAISAAKKRFAGTGFNFIHTGIEEYDFSGARYDFILVAGMLHHVDEATALAILQRTRLLSAEGGIVLIYDPDALIPSDPAYMRWFYKLEQGQFIRPHSEIEALVKKAGLVIREKGLFPIHPGLPGLPPVARFVRLVATWEQP
jgi:2-polyprenyl-3-methyl-5-hydroxy-6-metoxy-1,4-benzoquinol methylase